MPATNYWIGIFNPRVGDGSSTTPATHPGYYEFADNRMGLPQYASKEPYAHW